MNKLFILMLLASITLAPAKSGEQISIKIQVLVHTPYCGGARPDASMEQGNEKPLANTTFYLKKAFNHSKFRKNVGKYTTDQNGEIEVKITKGTSYYLVETAKIGSFEAFKNKYNQPGKDQEYIGDDEARKIWDRQDAVIKYDQGKNKVVLHAKCFTGLNPILKYTGPIPQ